MAAGKVPEALISKATQTQLLISFSFPPAAHMSHSLYVHYC